MRRQVTSALGPLVIGGAFAALVWLERRRPLRQEVEPKLVRDVRNLAVAATSAVAIQLTETPLVMPLAEAVERRRWGLLKWFRLPRWLEGALAIVLLDYTLYLWHVLAHRVPFLWRFHKVHHVDRDLDASTALRFHFAEMILSVPFRALQVVAIGVSPAALRFWQQATLVEILFHHSNVRLPGQLERWLSKLVVTPRMHGIHHSTVADEVNSNWSSGLTVWDWLHGTLRTDVPQEQIKIGVPGYDRPDQVRLGELLKMPFVEEAGNEPDLLTSFLPRLSRTPHRSRRP
ncbi:MAG: sterol desaturase family protein [Pirellulales bacterium]